MYLFFFSYQKAKRSYQKDIASFQEASKSGSGASLAAPGDGNESVVRILAEHLVSLLLEYTLEEHLDSLYLKNSDGAQSVTRTSFIILFQV